MEDLIPNADALSRRREEIDMSLARISAALDPLAAERPDWVQRLRPILDAELARLKESLATEQDDSRAQWQALTAISNKSERLAAEALTFVGGVSARSLELDQGVCDLADHLLATVATPLLVSYHPITMPASGEYVDVLSEVIRVRYPGRGIWDLPVVLHEFGHFLLRRLRMTNAGDSPAKIVEREGQKMPYLGMFSEELWADTLATYIGGPAYAAAALSRFDPMTAHSDHKPTHPASMVRATAIFTTLARLQAAWDQLGRASGNPQRPIELTKQIWQDRLEAAGVSPQPEEEQRSYAAGLTEQFIAALDREVVVSRYSGGQRSAKIRRALLEDHDITPEGSLIDALNGGWWARQALESAGDWHRLAAVEATTTAMCANIAAGGGCGT
jgi:hypothetical protein